MIAPYLLDTHALLWWRQDDPRLPNRLNSLIEDTQANTIYFSIASIWEIAIKRGLGKLKLDGSLEEFSRTLSTMQGFKIFPIEVTHLARVEKLPLHHRDPFDRLLIAQAIEIGATAITDDPDWKKYELKIKW